MIDLIRLEEIKNERAELRAALLSASADVCCAIMAGYTFATVPQSERESIIALRQRIFALDVEEAEMRGYDVPLLPTCLTAPPPVDPV